MLETNIIESQAQKDFQEALRTAFWRKARAWLGKGCNDLLSYREVFVHLKKQPQLNRGIQLVPLNQIVGSTGRSNEFDLAFYPRRDASEDRWVNVAKTQYQGRKTPPVLLYKVGEAYFVEDGNHRVSVARANGKITIQANVIEFDVSNLTPEPACTRLGYKLRE
jgi:hypothetical protein